MKVPDGNKAPCCLHCGSTRLLSSMSIFPLGRRRGRKAWLHRADHHDEMWSIVSQTRWMDKMEMCLVQMAPYLPQVPDATTPDGDAACCRCTSRREAGLALLPEPFDVDSLAFVWQCLSCLVRSWNAYLCDRLPFFEWRKVHVCDYTLYTQHDFFLFGNVSGWCSEFPAFWLFAVRRLEEVDLRYSYVRACLCGFLFVHVRLWYLQADSSCFLSGLRWSFVSPSLQTVW